MRLLRIAGLAFFLLSSITFIFYRSYKITHTDKTGPEITFPTDTIYTAVATSEEEMLKDVSAFDDTDGDVSKSLIIESVSKFIGPGKRIITYTAFDESNNITKKERYLIYTDYIPPRFTLSKPLSFNIGEYIDIIKYMKAEDCIDGDISNKIRYQEEDDYFGEVEGEYNVVFWVTNSCGDTSHLPVKVEYTYPNYNKDKTPIINLKDYIIYLKEGSIFNPDIYPVSFILGNKEYSLDKQNTYDISGKILSKNDIKIYSNVNINISGVYYVDYKLTIDEDFTGKTRLLVIVE